jgi:hypothetical protein
LNLDGPQFEINECLYELSKSLKGRITLVKSKQGKCDKLKLKCVSFKTLHKLDITLSSHQPCDLKNGGLLDGTLTAELIHGLINDGEGRGAHYGKFQLISSLGNRVRGQLWGITNTGTHHKPIGDCEPCDQRGHMEGRLAGEIQKDSRTPLFGCRLFGSYAINFDHSTGFIDTSVTGTLEGVIICECEKHL